MRIGVDPIDNPLQCHLQIVGYWLMGQLKVNWESLPSLLPKQHEPVDLEPPRSATSGMANDESQAGQDQPAPLR